MSSMAAGKLDVSAYSHGAEGRKTKKVTPIIGPDTFEAVWTPQNVVVLIGVIPTGACA